MLTDGGSIPPASTKFQSVIDQSRPTQTLDIQGVGQLDTRLFSVSNSPNKSQLWHKIDTNSAQFIQANLLTDNLGTESCRQFRQLVFSNHLSIAIDLAIRYAQTAKQFDLSKANEELFEIHNQLRISDLKLCADTDDIKEFAKRCADQCLLRKQKLNDTQEAIYECLKIVERYELTPPDIKDDHLDPCLNRLCDWKGGFVK